MQFRWFSRLILRETPDMRTAILALAALGASLTLSACGHNTEQKAATGAVAGAVVAGPVGAAVGGAAGAVAGKMTDEKR
jgi:osmotically inducible lipoprotein OsmB